MKIKLLNFIKDKYNRFAPKEHHLKDTILHKILGERIFEPELWKPSKKGIIWGVTLGTFVAFTPTIGGQMIIAGLLAVFFRINIPVSLLAVWISNPLTVIFIYSLEIKIGLMILGQNSGFQKIHSVKQLISYMLPLSIGGAILSITMGLFAYIVINIILKVGGSIKEHNPIHLPKNIPHPHLKGKLKKEDK